MGADEVAVEVDLDDAPLRRVGYEERLPLLDPHRVRQPFGLHLERLDRSDLFEFARLLVGPCHFSSLCLFVALLCFALILVVVVGVVGVVLLFACGIKILFQQNFIIVINIRHNFSSLNTYIEQQFM